MQLIKPLLGIFAVIGSWPNWESYFDLSRKGLKTSYVILALSLAPLWLIVYGVQSERARGLDQDIILPGSLPFILIVGIWLFSFPALAYSIGMIGCVFGLVGLGIVPFVLANGVLFAVYLGLLAADIRLAHKVVGFNWGMAILISCVIVAVGMTFVLLAISR